jgi:histidinol phosphatase-like PHP family hydrolase
MKFPINHDLHCHSTLSGCCQDPYMTPENILRHAVASGYTTICVTDHVWDADVPRIWLNDKSTDFYATQDISHISRALPLPQADGIRFLFGCETDYAGGDCVGISKEHFQLFDFVAIPTNHFHMSGEGIYPPGTVFTFETYYDLHLERLQQLVSLDLPWHKIGLAHIGVFDLEIPKISIEDEIKINGLIERQLPFYKSMFEQVSRLGAGVELNASWCMPDVYGRLNLPIYRVAKAAGCKFYCASDAHTRTILEDYMPKYLPAVIDALELTENDLFVP